MSAVETFMNLLKRLRQIGVEAEEELELAQQIDAEAWREKTATKGVDEMPGELLVAEGFDLAPLTDLVKGVGTALTELTDLVKSQAELIGALQTTINAQGERLDGMQKSLDETTTQLKATVDKAAQAVETADAVSTELKKSAAAAGRPLTPEMQTVIGSANGTTDPGKKPRFAAMALLD